MYKPFACHLLCYPLIFMFTELENIFFIPTKILTQERDSGYRGPHTTDLHKILAVQMKDISYYIMLLIFVQRQHLLKKGAGAARAASTRKWQSNLYIMNNYFYIIYQLYHISRAPV